MIELEKSYSFRTSNLNVNASGKGTARQFSASGNLTFYVADTQHRVSMPAKRGNETFSSNYNSPPPRFHCQRGELMRKSPSTERVTGRPLSGPLLLSLSSLRFTSMIGLNLLAHIEGVDQTSLLGHVELPFWTYPRGSSFTRNVVYVFLSCVSKVCHIMEYRLEEL